MITTPDFFLISEKRITISEIGVRNTIAFPSFTIRTSTFRTLLSLIDKAFTTGLIGHSFLCAGLSFSKTTSPPLTFGLTLVLFLQLWRVPKGVSKTLDLFPLLPIQRSCTKVSRGGQDSTNLLGKEQGASPGRLIWKQWVLHWWLPSPPPLNVDKISWVKQIGPFCSKMASRKRLASPINLSQDPPMWEAWARLKAQEHPFSWRYFVTAESFVAISNSLQVPTKLAPLSDRRSFAVPRIEKNLLKVLMKLSVDMASISSMCTALVGFWQASSFICAIWIQQPTTWWDTIDLTAAQQI